MCFSNKVFLDIYSVFPKQSVFFYELNVLIKNVSLIPYENFVKIYPYLISEWRQNCSSL